MVHTHTDEVIFLFLWERDVWLVRNASRLLIRSLSKGCVGSQGCRTRSELPFLFCCHSGCCLAGNTSLRCDPRATVSVQRNGA